MYILVPMDSDTPAEAKITDLDSVKFWTQILVEEGAVVQILQELTWDAFEALSEVIVVTKDGENIFEFMEHNMMVLVAHTQKTVDEIVEAYLFRELHDMAY